MNRLEHKTPCPWYDILCRIRVKKRVFCDKVVNRLFKVIERCMSKQKHESLVDEFDDLHHKKGVAEHLFERKDEIVNAFETIKEERTTAEDLNRYYVSVVKRFHTFYIQGEHDEIMALFKELQLDTKTLNQ